MYMKRLIMPQQIAGRHLLVSQDLGNSCLGSDHDGSLEVTSRQVRVHASIGDELKRLLVNESFKRKT